MSDIKYYLAVDIGASSGRHILGWVDKGKIRIEEIYRFENKLVKQNGHLCWDLEHLFQEVVEGLKKCKDLDRIPESVGIDTWGVDFVLLDKAGQVIGDTVAYRDGRTKGMDEEVYKTIRLLIATDVQRAWMRKFIRRFPKRNFTVAMAFRK